MSDAPRSSRRSIRNPDNTAAWRSRQRDEGLVFVQFWTSSPEVTLKLRRLCELAGPGVKPKAVIERLIMDCRRGRE
jgi:hypothetical protein